MLDIVKKSANWVLDQLPESRYIVLESEPDLSDNTMAVFQEMLRRNLEKKYRFIWWVKDSKADLPSFPNTEFMDLNTLRSKLLFRWILLRAKCVISCNKFLSGGRSSVISFNLTHGTALKHMPGYSRPEAITYTLIAGEGAREVMVRELKGDSGSFFALGYPRNDVLTGEAFDLHPYLEGDFKKVIVWYPTFRQHKNGHKTGSANALPILHDDQKARQLNECAKASGVLIVVKPHFAQDISYIRDLGLSNIRFIDDSFFKKNGISSYQFVGSCDALVTDYSSIYFDFLLCRKPVAVVWEDIQEYRKNPGFAIDPDYYMKGASQVYNLDDFSGFIRDVAEGRDPGLELRDQMNSLLNYSADGKNSERVVDFIMERAKLSLES